MTLAHLNGKFPQNDLSASSYIGFAFLYHATGRISVFTFRPVTNFFDAYLCRQAPQKVTKNANRTFLTKTYWKYIYAKSLLATVSIDSIPGNKKYLQLGGESHILGYISLQEYLLFHDTHDTAEQYNM